MSVGNNRLVITATFIVLSVSHIKAQADSNDIYPFAALPLAIEQSKSSGKTEIDSSVKPNIMFLIDDTGSMRNKVHDKYGISMGTRIEVIQSAMQKLIDEYRNKLNYYLLDLCGLSTMPQIGQPIDADTLMGEVRKLRATCGSEITDHSLEGFYEAIYFMRKNMNEAKNQYRCQTNAILFFSDGEMNYTRVKTDSNGVAYALEQPIVQVNLDIVDPPYYYSDYADRNRKYGKTAQSILQNAYNIHKRWWDCGFNEIYHAYGYFSPREAGKCRYEDNPDWKLYAKFAPNQDWSALVRSNSFDYRYYGLKWASLGRGALAGPADWVRDNDLVTYPRQLGQTKTDAAGKSWDDPKFKKQILHTFSVGLGIATGGEYLDGAAASTSNHKAILAQDPDKLLEAFKSILNKIISNANLLIPAAYSYNSPVTLGSLRLDGSIGVYLADGLIRSTLKFFPYLYEVGKDGKLKSGFDENIYFSPAFSSRKLFVSWKAPLDEGGSRNIESQPTKLFDLSTQASAFIDYANSSNVYASRGDKVFTARSIFGMPSTSSDTELERAMIPWLLGSNLDSEIAKQYKDYRVRSGQYPMGDVVDSPVVGGGKTIKSNLDCPLKATGTANDCGLSLQEYLVTSANDGMTYIFRRSSDNTHPYSLAFRYLPLQLDRMTTWEGTDTIGSHLFSITRTDYAKPSGSSPHLWLNNGGITVRSVQLKGKNQQTFMVASPGQGGRGLFALNIGGDNVFSSTPDPVGINKKDFTAKDVFIFDTPKAWYNDSGFIIGNPSIARLALCRKDGKPAAIVPSITPIVNWQNPWNEASVNCLGADAGKKGIDSGVFYTAIYGSGFDMPSVYDSSLQNKATTALNIRQIFTRDFGKDAGDKEYGQAGVLIRKISVPENHSGLGMPAVVDMDLDGVADLAYAVTKDGDLYRFDLRGNSPSAWSKVKIFSTPEVDKLTLYDKGEVIRNGTVKQTVIAAPSVYRYIGEKNKIRFIVTFGTGSNLYSSDLKDRTVQSLYSVEDRPEEEATPSIPSVPGNRGTGTTYLVERTIQDMGDNRNVLKLNDKPKSDDVRGWYVNLKSKDSKGYPSGERVVQSPIVVYGSSIYSSVVYINDESRTGGIKDSKDPCKVDKVSSNNSTKGWVMLFKSKDGDPSDSSKTAGLKIFSKQQVGIKQNEGTTGLSLFLPPMGKASQRLATNIYGQIGSGLDNLESIISKDCVEPGEGENARLIGQNQKGLKDNFGLTLPACPSSPTGLMRLNFRKVNM